MFLSEEGEGGFGQHMSLRCLLRWVQRSTQKSLSYARIIGIYRYSLNQDYQILLSTISMFCGEYDASVWILLGHIVTVVTQTSA